MDLIERYKLTKHPEGGYFRETIRSTDLIQKDNLPGDYNSDRSLFTTIYFLLEKEDLSHFHILKSDEMWFFHEGESTVIHTLSEKTGYKKIILGNKGQDIPQVLIPKDTWFAAELLDKNSYGFYSCVVCPGFEFDDFELAKKDKLFELFPNEKELIERLTLDKG